MKHPVLNPDEQTAVLITGASGGIGRALLEELLKSPNLHCLATSRTGNAPEGWESHSRVHWVRWDALDPSSFATVGDACRTLEQPIRLVVNALGFLHEGAEQPEKRLQDLDYHQLLKSFAVNAMGPSLIAREMLPLMPRKGPTIFASLSARVGSMGDNRLGGWYGYRASKAALNQFQKTLSIEWKRRNRDALVVSLHPGTVDTGLSAPFQRNVPEGKLFERERAATQLIAVLEGLTPEDTGGHFAWDGTTIPW